MRRIRIKGVNDMKEYAFGIDLGGTTAKVGLFTTSGKLLEKWEVSTDTSNNGAHILENLAAAVQQKMQEKSLYADEVEGVGLGVPGPVLDSSIVPIVCANLPYYITSPIVMKLLGDRLPIESLTVMVQKEAADRLAAAPGTRASSAISCAVSYYATSKMMFTAAPGSFYPAPKVTSAVVRMEIRPTPAVQVEDEAGYFALVRAAFGQRRKTAANAIASGLGMPKDAVTAAIEAAGFDARIRPEALTLEDFAKIQSTLAR